MTLRQKTISGVAWNTVGKISNQILQFVLSIILMRLLQPSDYGLLAMAMVLIGFAGIFSEFGFSSALIQNQNINETHKSSIFWLNIFIGAVLTLLFFVFADTVAQFYNNANLTKVIKYLSFSFIISAITIVPGTLLQKEMRYDLINKIDVSIVLLSGALSVYLAFAGWGVMSLVYQSLFSQILKVPILFISTKWKPKIIFNKKSIKELFSYSAYLTGFSIINYGARRSDDLLIGKFMDAGSLGIYSRAYNLMLMPITHVISLVSNVMFPALSSIQNEKERVKRIFLNVIQIIAFITFPIMIGLIAVADNFILGIFGNKWVEVIPIIQILAFVGVLQTLTNPVGWIYTSQGRTDLMFIVGLMISTLIIGSIIIGVLIGSIWWVAISYLIINVIIVYPVVKIPAQLINITFMEVITKVKYSFLYSIIMCGILFAITPLLPGNLPEIFKLISKASIGMFVYYLLHYILKSDDITQVLIMIKEIKYRTVLKRQ